MGYSETAAHIFDVAISLILWPFYSVSGILFGFLSEFQILTYLDKRVIWLHTHVTNGQKLPFLIFFIVSEVAAFPGAYIGVSLLDVVLKKTTWKKKVVICLLCPIVLLVLGRLIKIVFGEGALAG